ncbi:MAG: glycosyltransferase, partial [Anaerolineae bacterium]
MKIGIVTTAYALAAATDQMIETALRDAKHEREMHLFLHSGHGMVRSTCEHWAKHEAVVYYPYGTNRGLARSWNEGMLAAYTNGCDVVLIVNDDIVFSEGDVDQLAEYAVNHRENFIVTCRGWNHSLGKDDSIG